MVFSLFSLLLGERRFKFFFPSDLLELLKEPTPSGRALTLLRFFQRFFFSFPTNSPLSAVEIGVMWI